MHENEAKKVNDIKSNILLTFFDMIKSHFQMLVSIRSWLLVYHTDGVHHFVHDRADSFTSWSKMDVLFAALTPNRGTAPIEFTKADASVSQITFTNDWLPKIVSTNPLRLSNVQTWNLYNTHILSVQYSWELVLNFEIKELQKRNKDNFIDNFKNAKTSFLFNSRQFFPPHLFKKPQNGFIRTRKYLYILWSSWSYPFPSLKIT